MVRCEAPVSAKSRTLYGDLLSAESQNQEARYRTLRPVDKQFLAAEIARVHWDLLANIRTCRLRSPSRDISMGRPGNYKWNDNGELNRGD